MGKGYMELLGAVFKLIKVKKKKKKTGSGIFRENRKGRRTWWC